MKLSQKDFLIENLGKCSIKASNYSNSSEITYTSDEKDKIFLFPEQNKENNDLLIETAGAREMIYFNPVRVHAAIATCGGICPGLNNIIRAVVRCLWYNYGVRRISGIPFGYRGLLPESQNPFIELNPDIVDDIQEKGGTILGSSRGGGDRVEEIVDCLERMNINILFAVGGDGTLRGANDIKEEIQRRGLKIAVIGVPKTIDNDLNYIQTSFGVDTAVARAVIAVRSAHIEAKNSINGIGLVRVMGRNAGFIAANTTLAQSDVNFCLIPENPFALEGKKGLLSCLEKRILERHHAVILVAEGAGQDLLERTGEKDASGNEKFADIGLYLKKKINEHFKKIGIECNIKYIDPSYIIRSAPADSYDSIYCARLGAHAVHAAMSGKTGLVISLLNNRYVHLPIKVVTSSKNFVDLKGNLWRDVLENTRQPYQMKD